MKKELYLVDENGEVIDTISSEDNYIKLAEGDRYIKLSDGDKVVTVYVNCPSVFLTSNLTLIYPSDIPTLPTLLPAFFSFIT